MMEKKRFTWIKNTSARFGTIIDNQTNKDMMGTKETCSFMNKQEELIEELKDYQTVLSEGLANCTDERIRLQNENEQLKELIKKVLETTPMEHKLAIELKNSVRELYD